MAKDYAIEDDTGSGPGRSVAEARAEELETAGLKDLEQESDEDRAERVRLQEEMGLVGQIDLSKRLEIEGLGPRLGLRELRVLEQVYTRVVPLHQFDHGMISAEGLQHAQRLQDAGYTVEAWCDQDHRGDSVAFIARKGEHKGFPEMRPSEHKDVAYHLASIGPELDWRALTMSASVIVENAMRAKVEEAIGELKGYRNGLRAVARLYVLGRGNASKTVGAYL